MDQNWGRSTWFGGKRHLGGSGTCEGASYQKGEENMSQFEKFVTAGNEKADDLAKAGAILDEGYMAEAKAETMPHEREELYVALQYAVSFHCLVEQWKDCEELRPKAKEKWRFVEKKSENLKHRTEWCSEALMYEMWKRKQIHEDARKMYRIKNPDKKLGKTGKTTIGRP